MFYRAWLLSGNYLYSLPKPSTPPKFFYCLEKLPELPIYFWPTQNTTQSNQPKTAINITQTANTNNSAKPNNPTTKLNLNPCVPIKKTNESDLKLKVIPSIFTFKSVSIFHHHDHKFLLGTHPRPAQRQSIELNCC